MAEEDLSRFHEEADPENAGPGEPEFPPAPAASEEIPPAKPEEEQSSSELPQHPPEQQVDLPTHPDQEPPKATKPPELPQLRNGHEVLAEIQHIFWRQEIIARRLGWARKEFGGHRDPATGQLYGGVELEYREAIEAVEREMWKEHKEGKTKWPSEQTRLAIAHERMEEELILNYNALRGEIKNLETYQKILDSQMEGLRSLLSWFKEEARFASGGVAPPDFTGGAPPAPGFI